MNLRLEVVAEWVWIGVLAPSAEVVAVGLWEMALQALAGFEVPRVAPLGVWVRRPVLCFCLCCLAGALALVVLFRSYFHIITHLNFTA